MNKIPLPLKEYLARQIEEVLSPLNIWGTGQELDRTVDTTDKDDRNALFEHWARSGAMEKFHSRHKIVV